MRIPPDRKHIGFDFLALFSGALLPCAFAPLNLYILAVMIPALMFWCWHGSTPTQAFRRGYWFGLGLFGVGTSWVYIAISDFGFTSAPVAFVLTSLFVAFLALFPALQAWLSIRLIPVVHQKLAWLVFPALWLLFEWIRSWFMTGFPWLNLGFSQINSPLSGYAPILGVYGLSLLVLLLANALYMAALKHYKPALIQGITLLVIVIVGWILTGYNWTQPTGKPLSVAVVQGSLPQLTKWDPDKILHRMHTYRDLSAPFWGKKDLIVWPENALTILWQDAPLNYRDELTELAQQNNTSLILGLPYGNSDTAYYSSMLVLGKTPGVYHKRHLVPFGEYVPLGDLLRGIGGFFNLPMSGFSRGDQHQAHLQAAGQFIAPTICYEDAFAEELIDFLPKATLLVNGSNNAWYGRSWAPHQHLQISRMLALETGRQMIRATTTGISALIDQRGNIVTKTPQFQQVVMEGEVMPYTGATPFVRWGNWPVLIALWLVLAAMLVTAFWPRKR